MQLSRLSPYLYILPSALLLLMFMIYPLVQSVYFSFTQWDGLQPPEFTGLSNYAHLLKDSEFWNSLRITILWVVMSAVLLTIGGLILALLVEFVSGSKLFESINRTILFLPMTLSLVSIGLMFTLIYNPMLGMINNILNLLHISTTLDLLGNAKTSIYAVFVSALWQWSGFGMVIFSAALQGISQEIREAASIDGATKLQQIRLIIIPLLLPTAFIIAIIHMIGGFKAFDLIYVMTGGGPAQATQVTSIYLYKQAFTLHNFGYSSTIAVVLFIIILMLTTTFMRRMFRLG